MSFLSRLSRLLLNPPQSNDENIPPSDDNQSSLNSSFHQEGESERGSRDAGREQLAETTPYYPTLNDVLTVKGLLLRPLWRRDHKIRRGFPPEIIDMIIDWAEYWPSVYAEMHEEQIIAQDRDRVLVKTPPLCCDQKSLLQNNPTPYLLHRTQHPCRKLQFHISSHDQGWGGGTPNTYDGSFTWFDVDCIRNADQKFLNQSHRPAEPSSPRPPPALSSSSRPPSTSSSSSSSSSASSPTSPQQLPTLGGAYRLQTNRNQRGIPRSRIVCDEYDITWRWDDNIAPDSEEAGRVRMEEGRGEKTLDGEFVRSLCPGDAVVVWGRARFPGWTNYVKRLSVRMFWAV